MATGDQLNNIFIAHIGEIIDTQHAEDVLISQRGAIRYRDAYLLKYPSGEAWVFNYGVIVCWGLSTDEKQQLLIELAPLTIQPSDQIIREEYQYTSASDGKFRIKHDIIHIDNTDPLTRLALSHAFAQSTKLQFFEERAQRVIQDNKSIASDLAERAKVPHSRRKLAMLRGQLFETSCDISLHFNLLDTPEFFWDYPEVEEYYLSLTKYLDVKPRIEILNHKLATIHEMLDMLAAEQHHKHSSFLEWVIIILIAIDIVIYFLPK